MSFTDLLSSSRSLPSLSLVLNSPDVGFSLVFACPRPEDNFTHCYSYEEDDGLLELMELGYLPTYLLDYLRGYPDIFQTDVGDGGGAGVALDVVDVRQSKTNPTRRRLALRPTHEFLWDQIRQQVGGGGPARRHLTPLEAEAEAINAAESATPLDLQPPMPTDQAGSNECPRLLAYLQSRLDERSVGRQRRRAKRQLLADYSHEAQRRQALNLPAPPSPSQVEEDPSLSAAFQRPTLRPARPSVRDLLGSRRGNQSVDFWRPTYQLAEEERRRHESGLRQTPLNPQVFPPDRTVPSSAAAASAAGQPPQVGDVEFSDTVVEEVEVRVQPGHRCPYLHRLKVLKRRPDGRHFGHFTVEKLAPGAGLPGQRPEEPVRYSAELGRAASVRVFLRQYADLLTDRGRHQAEVVRRQPGLPPQKINTPQLLVPQHAAVLQASSMPPPPPPPPPSAHPPAPPQPQHQPTPSQSQAPLLTASLSQTVVAAPLAKPLPPPSRFPVQTAVAGAAASPLQIVTGGGATSNASVVPVKTMPHNRAAHLLPNGTAAMAATSLMQPPPQPPQHPRRQQQHQLHQQQQQQQLNLVPTTAIFQGSTVPTGSLVSVSPAGSVRFQGSTAAQAAVGAAAGAAQHSTQALTTVAFGGQQAGQALTAVTYGAPHQMAAVVATQPFYRPGPPPPHQQQVHQIQQVPHVQQVQHVQHVQQVHHLQHHHQQQQQNRIRLSAQLLHNRPRIQVLTGQRLPVTVAQQQHQQQLDPQQQQQFAQLHYHNNHHHSQQQQQHQQQQHLQPGMLGAPPGAKPAVHSLGHHPPPMQLHLQQPP
ncbi:hypothetical protein BOX15_Mlig027976g6 [Macrostomum lignano]|uniref:Uncharacterized protein n=1 Tax=Macrostomum lignano TaxID=282301 RepID=A0A267ETT7_9PLAT|nr:hypothetical protein BOX15_Mlig027976g6 [Macrostomum lignano]